jgi:hypothetical protein
MVFDEPCGAGCDGTIEDFEGGGFMVDGIDGFSDIVEEGRGEEFLVVGASLAGEFEDLQGVVEGVSLGMLAGVELDIGERFEAEFVDGEAVDVIGDADEVAIGKRGEFAEWLRGGACEGAPFGTDFEIGGEVVGADFATEDGDGLAFGFEEGRGIDQSG